MPNKFTEHFNLNQWEKTDKVLMDDFNADNAAIDAALFSHRSAEPIIRVTVNEEDENSQIELDISQVDWSRYMLLALIVDAKESNGFNIYIGAVERSVYMSSSQGGTVNNGSAVANLPNTYQVTMLIPVFYDGGHKAQALSFGFGVSGSSYAALSGGGSYTPLNQCKDILITHNSSLFRAGDKVELWGVK